MEGVGLEMLYDQKIKQLTIEKSDAVWSPDQLLYRASGLSLKVFAFLA